MKAKHLGTDHANQKEWFECPRETCDTRRAITREAWDRVPVLGRKPELRCACGLDAHIPASPSTIEAHGRVMAIATLMGAVTSAQGEAER